MGYFSGQGPKITIQLVEKAGFCPLLLWVVPTGYMQYTRSIFIFSNNHRLLKIWEFKDVIFMNFRNFPNSKIFKAQKRKYFLVLFLSSPKCINISRWDEWFMRYDVANVMKFRKFQKLMVACFSFWIYSIILMVLGCFRSKRCSKLSKVWLLEKSENRPCLMCHLRQCCGCRIILLLSVSLAY